MTKNSQSAPPSFSPSSSRIRSKCGSRLRVDFYLHLYTKKNCYRQPVLMKFSPIIQDINEIKNVCEFTRNKKNDIVLPSLSLQLSHKRRNSKMRHHRMTFELSKLCWQLFFYGLSSNSSSSSSNKCIDTVAQSFPSLIRPFHLICFDNRSFFE